jgi:PAS domain S-box-containing protein
MTQRSKAGSTKPQRRKAPAAKRRSGVETVRGAISSATKEELRFALLRRTLSEARRHRRRAEEALRESEHQLHQIIDTVPSFLWSADPAGEPTYVNQRALDYSGMQFEEFKHGGWEAFIHPDDFPGTIKAFGHAIETGTPYETVHRLRRWDGEYRWHQARGDPLRDRDGLIIQWYGVAVDIDDARKAEDRLRRSEVNLAEAQRLSNTGSWGINPATRKILYWSEECYRIWGFDLAQGLPYRASVFQRIHPDDRGRVLDEVERALRQKIDYTIEFRIVLPDGTVKYLEAICHHVFSEQGELIQLVGTNANVTERKHAEQALRESERKHRQLIGSIPCNFWSVNPNGEPTYVNQRLLDYFGIRFEDLKRDMTVLHPDDVAETERALNHAFQTGESFQRVHRLRRADGEYRWHRVRAEPLRDHSGNVIQWYGFSIDIDEGKKAEDALRRDEAWLAQAQRLSHTGTWVMNGTTKCFLYWSDESYRIWGLDPLQGLPSREDMWGRIHPDDRERVWGEVQEALREKRDFLAEFRILSPDGTVKWLEANTHHEFSPLGALLEVVCTNIDVTERNRAQDEPERLRQLESDLAHINRVSMMGEMAASLSHEILHPIAAARNNARAGMRFLEMSPPNLSEVKEALGCVVRDADRAKDIVGRIRSQIKRAPPQKERFDLHEAINEVIVMVRSAIAKDAISVNTRLMDGLVPVQGDRVQLQQSARESGPECGRSDELC